MDYNYYYRRKEEEVYKQWVNSLVNGYGIHIENVLTDITPPVLKQIAEIITGKQFTGMLSQKDSDVFRRSNYTSLLQFLEQNGVDTMNCTAENFIRYDSGSSYILSLLFSLYSFKTLSSHMTNGAYTSSTSMQQKDISIGSRIKTLINQYISPYHLTFQSIPESLKDGTVLMALHDCVTGKNDFQKTTLMNGDERLHNSVHLIEYDLGIKPLFSVEELQANVVPERVILLYLNDILNRFQYQQQYQPSNETSSYQSDINYQLPDFLPPVQQQQPTYMMQQMSYQSASQPYYPPQPPVTYSQPGYQITHIQQIPQQEYLFPPGHDLYGINTTRSYYP